MTIKKKIEQVIQKGADVSADKKDIKSINMSVRIPSDFLEKVDDAVKEKVGMTRNAWILQAMQEKLEKR